MPGRIHLRNALNSELCSKCVTSDLDFRGHVQVGSNCFLFVSHISMVAIYMHIFARDIPWYLYDGMLTLLPIGPIV